MDDGDFVPLSSADGIEHIYTDEQIQKIKKTAKLGKHGVPLNVLERKLLDFGIPDPAQALKRYGGGEVSKEGGSKLPKKRPASPPGKKPRAVSPHRDDRPSGPPPPAVVAATNNSAAPATKPLASIVSNKAGPMPAEQPRRPPAPPNATVTNIAVDGPPSMPRPPQAIVGGPPTTPRPPPPQPAMVPGPATAPRPPAAPRPQAVPGHPLMLRPPKPGIIGGPPRSARPLLPRPVDVAPKNPRPPSAVLGGPPKTPPPASIIGLPKSPRPPFPRPPPALVAGFPGDARPPPCTTQRGHAKGHAPSQPPPKVSEMGGNKSLPPRIDGPPRGSPPPRPSPVAAESPSGPPLMFSTKFRSAGIAVMAANGIDGKRGSRILDAYHVPSGPPPMFSDDSVEGRRSTKGAIPSFLPPESYGPIRMRSSSMASRAQQHLESNFESRRSSIKPVFPTPENHAPVRFRSREFSIGGRGDGDGANPPALQPNNFSSSSMISSKSSGYDANRRRQSSFAPMPWESGDYEIEGGGVPFQPPSMFKAKSEPFVGSGVGLSPAEKHVQFQSESQGLRSRGSSLALSGGPASPATSLYFAHSSTRQLSGLEEGEDEEEEDDGSDGENAGAVKKEMIEIQEVQKVEWEKMTLENETLKVQLQETRDSQNVAKSEEVVKAMRTLEQAQQQKYKEWEINNEELRAKLSEAQKVDKDELDLKIKALEDQLASEQKQHLADKEKLEETEQKIFHANEAHAAQMDSLKERNASLKVALDMAKKAGEDKKSENIRDLMKSLEANQTELFHKWQDETAALKNELEGMKAKEASTKDKIRRVSVTVQEEKKKGSPKSKKGKAKGFFNKLWKSHKHQHPPQREGRSVVRETQAPERVQRSSIILSQGPARVRIASSSAAIMSEMVRTEKMQTEEWRELQARQERLSLNLQKAQDDFAHGQVIETMKSLETTQQKMYAEWEEKNKSLRRQLEEAQEREVGVAKDAKGKDAQLDMMRQELEEERKKRGAGEEREEEMMRLIESNERKQREAMKGLERRNRELQGKYDDATRKGEEKAGEMVRKEMRKVEEMQQRLWKGWEAENIELRRQLADSAGGGRDGVEHRTIAVSTSFDNSSERSARSTTLERGEMHSDIVRRHLNSSVTDSGEYEVVHLERDEVEGRDHAESMKILATMNETEKSQLQEWRQLQDTSNSLKEEMSRAQEVSERERVVSNMAMLEAHQQKVYRDWEEVNSGLRKELEMAKAREAQAREEALVAASRRSQRTIEMQDQVQQQRQTIDEMNLQLKLLTRSLEIADKQEDAVMSQQLVSSITRIEGALERLESRTGMESARGGSVLSRMSVLSEGSIKSESVLSPGAKSDASSAALSPERWSQGKSSHDDEVEGLKLHHFESPLHLRSKLKSLFTRGFKRQKQQQHHQRHHQQTVREGVRYVYHHHHHHHGGDDDDDDDDVESVLSEKSEEGVGSVREEEEEEEEDRYDKLNKKLEGLQQQLSVLETKRHESMGAFSDVGSELSKELNEQKVIRRIAKARGESAVERGSRCREAKDVVQRMQSFEKEKNDVEKHFEDSKKGLVWEIKKLKNVLFGWGRGGGAKKKRLDLEFKISEEDRMGIGTSYLEDPVGEQPYELEGGGKGAGIGQVYKQAWYPEGRRRREEIDRLRMQQVENRNKQWEKLKSMSPKHRNGQQQFASNVTQPPPPPLQHPQQAMRPQQTMRHQGSYHSPPLSPTKSSPTRSRDIRDTRSLSPRGGRSHRSGGYSYSNPYDVATGSRVVSPPRRSLPKMLNHTQKRNREKLDLIMAPIVGYCEVNKALNMGMSAELVSLLKVKGRHWSGKTASIADLIAINAEVGASRRIPDPPGKIRIIKAIDAVLSTERVESMRRGRGWKCERTKSPMRGGAVRSPGGAAAERGGLGYAVKGEDRDAVVSAYHLNLMRGVEMGKTKGKAVKGVGVGGGREERGFMFGVDHNDDHMSNIHVPAAGRSPKKKSPSSKAGYAQIHAGLSPKEANDIRMGGGGISEALWDDAPAANPGLRKGVSHEDMLMGSNLMRTTQRVTFSPQLERHQSEETYLDVGSLAGSLDFADVLGGGMKEDLVKSAKTGKAAARPMVGGRGGGERKDRNHELSETVTESYKMHMQEEVKPPPLRGQNLKMKGPKKLQAGEHVSHHAELPTQNWESKFTREALLKEITEKDWQCALHKERTMSQAAIALHVPEGLREEFAEVAKETKKAAFVKTPTKEERMLAEIIRKERTAQRKAEREKAERIRKREEREMEKRLKESQSRLRGKHGQVQRGLERQSSGGWK